MTNPQRGLLIARRIKDSGSETWLLCDNKGWYFFEHNDEYKKHGKPPTEWDLAIIHKTDEDKSRFIPIGDIAHTLYYCGGMPPQDDIKEEPFYIQCRAVEDEKSVPSLHELQAVVAFYQELKKSKNPDKPSLLCPPPSLAMASSLNILCQGYISAYLAMGNETTTEIPHEESWKQWQNSTSSLGNKKEWYDRYQAVISKEWWLEPLGGSKRIEEIINKIKEEETQSGLKGVAEKFRKILKKTDVRYDDVIELYKILAKRGSRDN